MFKTLRLFNCLRSVNDFPLLKKFTRQLTEQSILDEMAFPAYFEGNMLSRAVFFGRLSWFLQPVNITAGSYILDFGCGLGLLAPYISKAGGKYYGVDITPEVARSYAEKISLENTEFHSSLATLDSDRQFDTILALDVLEHVEDIGAVIDHLKAIIKPDGQIVICGPSENALYKLGRKIVGFSGEYHHRSISDIFVTAGEHGLIMTHKRRWPLPGPATLFQCAYFSVGLPAGSSPGERLSAGE